MINSFDKIRAANYLCESLTRVIPRRAGTIFLVPLETSTLTGLIIITSLTRFMHTNDRDPHILLVEDDNEDILFFQLAIRSLPFAVLLTTAENGLNLVDLLEQAFPDVIFLDNFMPYKSGQECIREIRANRKYDSIPIIIYTSHKSPQLAETAYRNGANLYVLKPKTMRELVEKIQMILKMDWSNSILFQHQGGSELSS